MTEAAHLRFEVASTDGTVEPVAVGVRAMFNFGYAARDQDGLRAHLAECAQRGLPVPGVVPSLYPVLADRVTVAPTLAVLGGSTYAEVEYALIRAPGGRWLITVASDHSDAEAERESTPRGKNLAANVLAPAAWWLDEVADDLDAAVLCCERLDGDAAEIVQRDPLATLLAPEALLALLAERTGTEPADGTVILSGTINGEPPVGARRWRISLQDGAGERRIEHSYDVDPLPEELR
jgi:hypothetical protein